MSKGSGKPGAAAALLRLGGRGSPRPADIALATRQLATMLRAGVPLVQSFDIVADGLEKPGTAQVLRTVRGDLSGGSGLAAALRKHPQCFDQLYCNLVDAGEQAGALDSMLDRVAAYQEKTLSLKAKVRKALTYPVAVIIVALVVSAILLIEVVPQFQEIFAGFGADLPPFTLFVIGVSEALQAWWWLVLLGISGAGAGFVAARKRSQGFRRALDQLALKLPVAGNILAKSAIARYARTLATSFAAGVPLVEALSSVAGSAGNSVYQEAAAGLRDGVSTGRPLHAAMRSAGLFPSILMQMVAIGEEAGALDAMLDKSAAYYEEQVDRAVDNLTALMEPAIMALLGILVGGLILAMYLPVFQLGTVVG